VKISGNPRRPVESIFVALFHFEYENEPMSRIRKWVKDFFSVSHAQANGLMILIPLMAGVILSEPLWRWYNRQLPTDYSKDRRMLDSLVSLWDKSDPVSQNANEIATTKVERFTFDPNTASQEQLSRMGFPASLSIRLIRYRERGGKFKRKEDLLKIYGMDTTLYQQLAPWIRMPDNPRRKAAPTFAKKGFERRPPKPVVERFDVNLADTAQLSTIRGIGTKLSQRIVRYREGLGGFINMTQLKEVYGLDSTVIENLAKSAFVSAGFEPKRLNINTADAGTLAKHPYVTDKEARSIVAYRFQHGNFESLDDLRAIQVLSAENLLRILPYVTLN
jgi:DNA uptake protein ComE-like DNA-binding protein